LIESFLSINLITQFNKGSRIMRKFNSTSAIAAIKPLIVWSFCGMRSTTELILSLRSMIIA
jgi:hypothetical protein